MLIPMTDTMVSTFRHLAIAGFALTCCLGEPLFLTLSFPILGVLWDRATRPLASERN